MPRENARSEKGNEPSSSSETNLRGGEEPQKERTKGRATGKRGT